jgi:hypothetical protein
MQFQARIFVSVRNPGARIAGIGAWMFFGSLVLFAALEAFKVLDTYAKYWLWLFGLAILCMIVGRIVAKGNMFTIGLSDTDLVVGEDGVQVGNELYPLDQLTDLDFMIEGYDGAQTIRRGIIPLIYRRAGRLTGANNKIHFRAGGKRHLYQFYLPDRLSMQQLGLVFRIFYERSVPFGECNRGGRTFLFNQVRSKKELEELRSRSGIR